ncbi:MAG TPA: hypothetical protein VD931_10355 [Baekduia sp.]|nr:hypothetical protein [Baekduia sp.]
MGPAARNVLIIVALAAAVAFLPGGGRTADFLAAFLSVAVLASIVMILARFYRENRPAVFGLGERHRLLLHGALGAIVLGLAGRDKLLDSGPGILAFFVLLGGAAFALVAVWRHHREYGI